MLTNYFKIAIKVLLRRKFFTFVSLFGISFTILILMVVVALVDHTIGRHAPETRLDRTLSVIHTTIRTETGSNMQGPLLSYYVMNKYVKSLETPEKVSLSSFWNSVITYKENKKIEYLIKYTDAEFWDILEFNFLEGRPFSKQDVDNIDQVAVINEDLRKRYFGDNPALGGMIEAEGKNYRVIGVVENVPALRLTVFSDMWVPITSSKENLTAKILMGGFPGHMAMILAKDRSDFDAIRSELDNKIANMEQLDFEYSYINVHAETYAELLSRVMRLSEESNIPALLLFVLFLIILFMILPTINLVNINVSRILERASEIGVRKSFGASSMTLAGQFIVENLILTFIGGAIGLIMTAIALGMINDTGVFEFTRLTINHRVFLISIFICLLFGFISGVYPAYKMSKLKPVDALRGGKS